MKEIFKVIPNYSNYECSNYGRVRRVKSKRYLKPSLRANGYVYVTLCKNCKSKNILLHRLICSMFNPNTNNYKYVNHIDEDKTNNRSDNLEWCSQSHNLNYGDAQNKRNNNRNYTSHIRFNPTRVGQYDIDGNLLKEYPSYSSTEKDGFSKICVNSCCNGKQKTHKGFVWKKLQ